MHNVPAHSQSLSMYCTVLYTHDLAKVKVFSLTRKQVWT